MRKIIDPRSKPARRCGTTLVLLSALWLPQAVLSADAGESIDVTGKLTKSPVLGPRAPDGIMGGLIPSAVPGWSPNADARDAYVYMPREGWTPGDTRAERSPHGQADASAPGAAPADCPADRPCRR